MRLIKRSEIKKSALQFANIFKDYKAYSLLFPFDKHLSKRIYQCFLFELTLGADYTYVYDEDFSALATIKRPLDKERKSAAFWRNPIRTISFFSIVGIKSAKLAADYVAFAKSVAKNYYNPDTDCYIKNIGVIESARGQGILRKMIEELCSGFPVILETHSADNVEIYKKLGFELLEALPYRTEIHYIMKRK